jgi:hypothetical protein
MGGVDFAGGQGATAAPSARDSDWHCWRGGQLGRLARAAPPRGFTYDVSVALAVRQCLYRVHTMRAYPSSFDLSRANILSSSVSSTFDTN